jgi:hypothetical protein
MTIQIVQIVEEGKTSSSLKLHEADLAGQPRCGTKPRPWHGVTMVVHSLGEGIPTCSRCRNLGP